MTRLTYEQLAQLPPRYREAVAKQLETKGGDIFTAAGAAAAEAKVHPTRRGRPEQDAGKALVQWIDALVLPNGLKPGLFFAHTPNGGFRDAIEAAIFYGQGVRRGWPDYTLYLPRHHWHGLVLELKAPDGAKPDAEQLEVLARLEAVGYKACVAWGFDDARTAIARYLDLIQ